VSRLWSRYGLRTLSVALLVVAIVGGMYLGRDRDAQQRGIDASVATEGHLIDDRMIKERAAAHIVATSRQRSAQREAAAKAVTAAKKAAQRAKRVADAGVRKKAAAATEAKKKKTVPFSGPIPESCNEYSGNRKIGCALMLDKGFDLDQFPCLDKLWKRESGWNHRARNNSSGAYGVPQALPGNKMASAGDDWEDNPATQIKWGLGYIKGRYGTPCEAWQHSEDVGWY
jgi:hypothetical protein